MPGAIVSVGALGLQLSAWLRQSSAVCPSVFIDVSCMPRPVMASAFEAVFAASADRTLRLDVGYVLAEYEEPPATLPPNEDIRPINNWFAGWPSDATAPTVLVVGLGYERAKAEGACEFFDASETWVFEPRSPIKAYDRAVVENNQAMLERARRREKAIPYRVDRPSEMFSQLATVVSSVLPRANPVLLPFGPKIFFAVSLLVAAAYEEAGVWHVTGDADIPTVGGLASDYIIALRVNLGSPSR
jgi:hypothetical protein